MIVGPSAQQLSVGVGTVIQQQTDQFQVASRRREVQRSFT